MVWIYLAEWDAITFLKQIVLEFNSFNIQYILAGRGKHYKLLVINNPQEKKYAKLVAPDSKNI